jgi:hypothetical protein
VKAMPTAVRTGAEDVERRLARLTAAPPRDERAALECILSSRVFRSVSSILRVYDRASESSLFVRYGRAAQVQWQAAHWSARWRASGVMLVVAAAVHLLLARWDDTTPGWLWMIVPAAAMTIGTLLLLAGTHGSVEASAGDYDRSASGGSPRDL